MRVLFLFLGNWQREVADCESGKVPSHRLFGYAELKKLGGRPSICPMPQRFGKLLTKPLVWRIYQALFALFHQRETDCIFAVNEASALPVLVLKQLGLLRTPVIIFNCALTNEINLEGMRYRMWRWLLPCSEAVISQTKMELDAVWSAFGLRRDRQLLIHMMVDLEFCKPECDVPRADYILAVGTTAAKDYPTLLAALPRGERLIIVTDAYNAEIIKAHLRPGMAVEVLQAVQMKQLKRMYQEAKVIVNPMKETPFGSGHTVVLENMALGNVVIVSAVGGMADYFEDGVSAIGVKPCDVHDLSEKLRHYLEAPSRFDHIRQRAPGWVKSFSSDNFARRLSEVFEKVCQAQNPRQATQPPTARLDNNLQANLR